VVCGKLTTSGDDRRPPNARLQTSLTPHIDFDLGDEPGSSSPDASVGIGKDGFAIRWTGRLVAPHSGMHTLRGDCDGTLRLWLDETLVLEKGDHRRDNVRGKIELAGGRAYRITIEYVHRDGPASNHVYWSGPGFDERVLTLGGINAAKGNGRPER